jgi:TIR domain-containing protein
VSAGPTESRSVPGPKVFITYRREETAAHAGRLYDAMVARFGESNVFMDVDMAPGVDFVERITEAVAACHVLIVVMGPRWATVVDEHGRARLADPEDFVRLEVETALRRPDVTPIPVLVAGARMPNREDLPPEVRAITRRNALELSDQRWRYDVGRLISTLDELLAASPLVPGPPSADRTVATGKAARADAAQTAGQTAPPATVAGPASVETKRAVPLAGGGRRMRWALLGAVAIAAIVVAVVFAVSGGGGDGDEDRLRQVIPASVQEAGCKRVQGKTFWMDSHGAEVQMNCQLPSSTRSEAVQGGGLSYGLFPSAGKARDFVRKDSEYEVNRNDERFCGERLEREMEADYRGGNARCFTYKKGVVINWSLRGSPVGVQLYFDPGTSHDAAVAAREKLL